MGAGTSQPLTQEQMNEEIGQLHKKMAELYMSKDMRSLADKISYIGLNDVSHLYGILRRIPSMSNVDVYFFMTQIYPSFRNAVVDTIIVQNEIDFEKTKIQLNALIEILNKINVNSAFILREVTAKHIGGGKGRKRRNSH
jgi:hypothetical protein